MTKLRVCITGLCLAASFAPILGPSSAGAQEGIPASPDSASADSVASPRTGALKAQTLTAVRVKGSRDQARYKAGYSRTATKSPALARDVPQSITAVTKALAGDQGMTSMADVVRYVPGISMGQGEGNRDQPTIRGNSSTADFFVDGVRDDAQYFRDLYNLERVEALTGSNAMVFGRGGGGGVLNRVTKEARWNTSRDVSAEAGSFGSRRMTMDLQQTISASLAARLNSVYENSDLFRDGVSLERSGVNPTLTLASPSRATSLAAGYEHFQDRRTADRGIPSFEGRPVNTGPSTFFGNSDASFARMGIDAATVTIVHDAGRAQVRNNTRIASYDKFYQNIYPGAVSASGEDVSISAYNHAIGRSNIFNQTDVTLGVTTGSLSHDLLIGAEAGRQSSNSRRLTGYFGESATSTLVPVSRPFAAAPAAFRQSATDADNATLVNTGSLYAQDQVTIVPQLRVIAGVRYERFHIRFNDHRSLAERSRTDGMFSPRAGIVVKPARLVSLYASYGLSFLPGSGDQFGSLTEATKALAPERFANYEAGAKWDALDRLAITTAVYRLDRTNTRAIDPADPVKFIQTGAQRSRGLELSAIGSVTPSWHIAAAFAQQKATITSATSSSVAGARVPLVPRTSVSVWNRYSFSPRFGAAIGAIRQSSVFAAIDNKVTLPAFTRFDAALFAGIGWGLKAQVNVENIFDVKYFPSAHSNNNISPGSPRAAKVSITAAF